MTGSCNAGEIVQVYALLYQPNSPIEGQVCLCAPVQSCGLIYNTLLSIFRENDAVSGWLQWRRQVELTLRTEGSDVHTLSPVLLLRLRVRS